MRYFIHLAYDGTNYRGWQKQKEVQETIQETIERALFRLFKEEISIYGCGRTDAGVHASQYALQINLTEAPSFDFKFRLNKHLPDDIAVFDILEVKDYQHCRYDATSRTYDYFIHWNKEPGLIRYSSFYDGLKLDFNLIEQAIELIRNTKDFRALCKQPDAHKNTLCNIIRFDIFVDKNRGRMRFNISANRFLRGMIRICVYYLLEIGKGKISLAEFSQILDQKIEINEKSSAYPNGLFLSKIEYPYLEIDESSNLIKMLRIGLD